LDALREMGARISLEHERTVGGEPVADLRTRSSRLRGITVSGALVPRLIDELPLIAVAGAVASGVTEIRDAAELRVKESDRIKFMTDGLRRLGASVEERPDGMLVRGGGKLAGAVCESFGDHRIAMGLAVAGLVAEGATEIRGAEAVAKSYKGFWDDLARLTGEGRGKSPARTIGAPKAHGASG
jgi:3-phosphoshikimate 1-carboxyvinyltransferase